MDQVKFVEVKTLIKCEVIWFDSADHINLIFLKAALTHMSTCHSLRVVAAMISYVQAGQRSG